MEKYILTKKAQIWSIDLAIACVIFLIGIITLYVYAFNFTNQAENNLKNMFYDGNIASEILLSNDYPGLISNDKINQTKLEKYNNEDYVLKKRLLNIRYDFYFTIDNLEINGSPAEYIGKNITGETDNKIKITRFVIYKNKPSKFEFYIWK